MTDPLILAAWGAVNAWDDYDRADWPDDAEALNQLAGSLAPWMEALHHVLADDQPPDDDLTGGDIAAMAAECEAQQERIADLELDNEGLSRHVGAMEHELRRYLAALDERRSTRPTPHTTTAQGFADFANAADEVRNAESALRALVDGQPEPDTARQHWSDPLCPTCQGTCCGCECERCHAYNGGPAIPGPTREQAEIEQLRAELDEAQLRSIEARNPGIDMDEVRRLRGNRPSTPTTGQTAEAVAQAFHETYERLAPSFGYETRKASAVPWAEVPDQNKRLMVAVAGELLALFGRSAPEPPAEISVHTSPLCVCRHEQRYHTRSTPELIAGCSWIACNCRGFDPAPTVSVRPAGDGTPEPPETQS